MSKLSGFNITPSPTTLTSRGIRLEPLTLGHEAGLKLAAADGNLWDIRVTSVPEPENTAAYIKTAVQGLEEGHRVPFAVIDEATGKVMGTTSYHDIIHPVGRLEIGFTWYARSHHRTHVNTTCKLMLMEHAFDTLGASVVGWRTDNYNFASQRAIERLGAKLDGVIRHHALRRDGTVRDTYMYSVTAGEWPEIRAHLLYQFKRHAS